MFLGNGWPRKGAKTRSYNLDSWVIGQTWPLVISGSWGFLHGLSLPIYGVGRLGTGEGGGGEDCLFPKVIGSSFSLDGHVKAVCCAGSMWIWPVRDHALGKGLLQEPWSCLGLLGSSSW